MALQRILAATDLEEKTDAALRHAALLASELGAELVVTPRGSHAQQILLDSPIPVVGVKPDWKPQG